MITVLRGRTTVWIGLGRRTNAKHEYGKALASKVPRKAEDKAESAESAEIDIDCHSFTSSALAA